LYLLDGRAAHSEHCALNDGQRFRIALGQSDMGGKRRTKEDHTKGGKTSKQ
jgi:hypothetical protein